MDLWKTIAIGVAAVVAILVATQPLYVVGLTLFDYGQTPDASYSTMQTKDVSRFPVDNPQRQSELTAQAARPAGSGLEYSTVVRVPENDWQAAVAASRLRASEDAILLFGNASAPNGGNGTDDANVSTVTVSGGNSAETAAEIATRGNSSDDVSPNNVIIVSSEAPRWALPAAAWSAYSGDPILYANQNGTPDATQRAIEETNASHAYVLAPPRLVSDDALSELDVRWTRVAGQTPQAHAVEVAEFRDESRDFGWGIHERDKVGYYNFMLVNPGEWEHGVSTANLQYGKAGPILLVNEDGSLPAVTENYAWQTQPAWFSTPAEGPFNHLFAMGSTEEVSWVSQGRLDYAVEITQYRHQGAGLSPLESLAAVWAAFSLLGSSFVFAHSRHRLPEMNDWTKMVWPLFTLVLGPFGLGLYWLSYRGRQIVTTDQGPRVLRPYWLRAATATAMGVGFAASTMIATAFLLNYFGIPMLVIDGPLFWLGNAMTLLIVIVYVVAFLVSWLVFHIPMLMDSQGLDTRSAAEQGAKIVAVSMTSVSIGMMGGMWVLMMLNLEMMPGDDNILWFGVMAFATLVGFLIAWPVNGLLVRRNLKPGGAL
ncbi:DUF4396 domain-containing protein [Halorarum salinum]|uniref:DUF4396 domain-containing protein n=1 Tax=Halorarum salinum TaxID=2743089 RepID=A0A7D5LAU9_9EURY|nr:DUF4396 domain-containing protein [Halobaculum salinum]QLG62111.1 DUF4396 domain-containing protein [Halobaculum salinum]